MERAESSRSGTSSASSGAASVLGRQTPAASASNSSGGWEFELSFVCQECLETVLLGFLQRLFLSWRLRGSILQSPTDELHLMLDLAFPASLRSQNKAQKKGVKSSHRKQELSQISLQVSSTRAVATLYSSGTMSAGIEIPYWFDKQSAAFLVCHI